MINGRFESTYLWRSSSSADRDLLFPFSPRVKWARGVYVIPIHSPYILLCERMPTYDAPSHRYERIRIFGIEIDWVLLFTLIGPSNWILCRQSRMKRLSCSFIFHGHFHLLTDTLLVHVTDHVFYVFQENIFLLEARESQRVWVEALQSEKAQN